MHLSRDGAYVFSVARDTYGKIVACRSKGSQGAVGKDVFKHLKMSLSEVRFFEERLFAYGKIKVAAIGEKRVVLFFKDFAYDTALCFAIALELPIESAAVVLRGFFLDFAISDGLGAFGGRSFSLQEDKQSYERLARVVGQAEALSRLKIQRSAETAITLREVFLSIAELIGVEAECDVVVAEGDEFYSERPEIFNGRFCTACFLMLSIIAHNYSRDGRICGEFIGGIESLRLCFRFENRGTAWRDALDLLGRIASSTHAMDFGYESVGGTVTVNLVPFYADVGFVGVKQGEGGVAIEELEELY